jgi:SAM-dependent methyltransferase
LTFERPQPGDRRPYDPGFYPELAGLEEANFWFSSRNRLIAFLLGKHFSSARTFLEVGCGTGLVLAATQRARPCLRSSGCDLYPEGLRYARARNPAARLLRMDAARLYFEEEFDLLGAFDLLEHVEDDEAVLREMHRALRPGGGLLLSVPQHRLLWTETDVAAHHVRRYGRRELRTKVAGAGFRVLEMVSFVSLLLPVLAAARLAGSALKKRYSVHGELGLNPILNSAFGTLMGAESALVRLGLRLPFGGSLVISARRV